MKIEVTQEHIDKGARCKSTACPIFIAIKDKIPNTLLVSPDFAYLHYDDKEGYQKSFELPTEVKDFIRDFDNGRAIHPFSFDVDYEGTKNVSN